jgi:mannobiose 2-epimerase
MPYWHDLTRDDAYGGYRVPSDVQPPRFRRVARHLARRHPQAQSPDKQLVSQSRLVWLFSHAHRKGLARPGRDYLAAATTGYQFLLQHFHDPDHGGYVWMTDPAGRRDNDAKILYGQAFVIYAFVEYARAAADRGALRQALDLHRVVDKHLHDDAHGGWFEHAEPDWRLMRATDSRAAVEVVGLKSANAHLHWLEALTELYDATGDEYAGRSLTEACLVNHRHFYPADPGRSCQHRGPDWSAVPGEASSSLSYGHNVQFAWMLIRAEAVLGLDRSWDVFHAHVDHALRYGYDHARGGVYHVGSGDMPATGTKKLWWVQAEAMVALTDALLHCWEQRYSSALVQTIRFVERHQTDRADGIWLESVTAAGRRQRPRKAGRWKVGYHEVRALVRIVEAFGLTSRAS